MSTAPREGEKQSIAIKAVEDGVDEASGSAGKEAVQLYRFKKSKERKVRDDAIRALQTIGVPILGNARTTPTVPSLADIKVYGEPGAPGAHEAASKAWALTRKVAGATAPAQERLIHPWYGTPKPQHAETNLEAAAIRHETGRAMAADPLETSMARQFGRGEAKIGASQFNRNIDRTLDNMRGALNERAIAQELGKTKTVKAGSVHPAMVAVAALTGAIAVPESFFRNLERGKELDEQLRFLAQNGHKRPLSSRDLAPKVVQIIKEDQELQKKLIADGTVSHEFIEELQSEGMAAKLKTATQQRPTKPAEPPSRVPAEIERTIRMTEKE